MKFLIRWNPIKIPFNILNFKLGVVGDGFLESISRFEVFFTIQRSSFYKSNTLIRTTQQNKIGRKHILRIGSNYVPYLYLTPVSLHKFAISEDFSHDGVVRLLIRFITLVIFIAWVTGTVPSRNMEMAMTPIKGVHATNGSNGLICGMLWRIAITKKYTFASLLNWRTRASVLRVNYVAGKWEPCTWRFSQSSFRTDQPQESLSFLWMRTHTGQEKVAHPHSKFSYEYSLSTPPFKYYIRIEIPSKKDLFIYYLCRVHRPNVWELYRLVAPLPFLSGSNNLFWGTLLLCLFVRCLLIRGTITHSELL